MKTGYMNSLRAKRGFVISLIISVFMLLITPLSSIALTPVEIETAVSSVAAQPESSVVIPARFRKNFNHLTTGFPITGAHVGVTCETCHVSGNFKGTPKDCASCHSVGRMITATAKPQKHIITTKACDACHTSSASFSSYVMNHSGLTQTCSSCHNGSFSDIKSKSPNHIDSTGECDACHKNTFTFLGAGFDHTGIVGDCATCHNNQTAVGLGSSHIPTNGAVCELCHTKANTSNFANFRGATFDHSTIGATSCSSCHGGQSAGVMKKPTSHIASSLDCAVCHSSTITPGGFATWTMNHTGMTTGCASCHNGTTAGTTVVMGKPASHIATTADCESCHTSTTSPGGFATWTMNHSGLTKGCASCHNGATAGTTVVMGKPTYHIATGTMECESCHTDTTPGGFSNWVMNHTGITTACASCHNGVKAGSTLVVGKPTLHIPVGTIACESCHSASNTSTGGFVLAPPTMNHTIVSGTTCDTCHDTGKTYQSVVVKPANHIAYLAGTGCDSCHTASNTSNFANFLGATGAHTVAPSGTCVSCHTGGTPGTVGTPGGGKNMIANHIPINSLDCSSCHSWSSFITWKSTDVHTSMQSTTCDTCHGIGKSYVGVVVESASIHVPIGSIACDTCHKSTVSFTPTPMGTSGHNLVNASSCETCHDAGKSFTNVVIKPQTHIPTSTGCISCHTESNTSGYSNFLGAVGTHATNPVPSLGATCALCHGGGSPGGLGAQGGKAVSVNHISTGAADCGACHDYKSFTTWKSTWNHNNVTGSVCSSCHNTGLSFAGVVTKPASPPHIPSTSTNPDCGACHKTTSTFTGWLATNVHANIGTTRCDSCHNTGQTYSSVVVKPATHIPYNSGIDCNNSGCHSSTTSFTTWAMATAGHTAVATSTPLCATCHGSGKTYPGVKLITATHITGYPTTDDCGLCHTSTNTGGYTSFLGMNMTGLPGHTGITTCIACHNGQYAGVVSKANFATHVATTADCSSCHTPANTSNYQNFLGATGSHSTNPLPSLGTTCYGCHGGTNPATTGAKGISVGHIPTATVDCATSSCHTYTTFTGGNMASSHAALKGIKTCDDCHNGSFTTQGTLGAQSKTYISNHIPTTITANLTCDTCHTGTPVITAAGFLTGEKMNHNASQGGASPFCVDCHLTGKNYLGTMRKFSHKGASATATKDCSSSGCHKPRGSKGTAYSVWD